MSVPPAADEKQVEARLRSILAPLDWHMDWSGTLLAVALGGVMSWTGINFWIYQQYDVFRSGGVAVAAGGAVIAVWLMWDALMSRIAVWRFLGSFRANTPERELAMRILAEMETPTRVESRLREQLARVSGRRIRRVRGGDAPPVADPLSGAARPGYYDYIPLEPKKTEDRPPLGQG